MHGLTGYYTLQEVCELTTLSEWTIKGMEKNGRFPKRVKMASRRIAYEKTEIHRWLALRDRWRPKNGKGDEDE
ncbi:AlpA family phage regulatory protein [Sinorhizobium meliloti]|nr:AlpA family phage regulatory protein [Sinorhizobium meliloti]